MTRVPLWHNTGFRLVWLGQTVSIFGDRVTGIALPWLLLAQTHSAFDASLVAATRYLPLLALGLAAGIIVDRVPRRSVMIFCDVGRALALGCVFSLGLLHVTPPFGLLVLVALVLGAGQLGFQTAYRAWLPDIIGENQLSRASSTVEASDAAGTLAGPTVGGGLIQLVGAVLALGADALSYVVSALTLIFVGEEEPHTLTSQKREQSRSTWRTIRQETLEGVRLIITTPALRLLRLVSTPLYLSSGAIELLLATLTQLRLHLPAWQAGLVFSAQGVGGLVGSVLAPRLY